MFFPVPFAYYDPSIVYRQTLVPDVIPVHRDTGRWDQGRRDMACFDNKDYKDLRMNSEEFLKEHTLPAPDLMQVHMKFDLFWWGELIDVSHVFQAQVGTPIYK